jgi:hypothetical protein
MMRPRAAEGGRCRQRSVLRPRRPHAEANNQREQNLKFELLIPVESVEKPTACMSFNYHQDHFGSRGARTADGAAHTACVGFGMERWRWPCSSTMVSTPGMARGRAQGAVGLSMTQAAFRFRRFPAFPLRPACAA